MKKMCSAVPPLTNSRSSVRAFIYFCFGHEMLSFLCFEVIEELESGDGDVDPHLRVFLELAQELEKAHIN